MWVDKILHLEIDPLVQEGIKVVIEEIITIGTITGQIIEIDQEADGTTTGQVIGVVITHIITDVVIQDHITDKTHNGLLETEVKVEVEMKAMVMIIFRGRSRDRNQRRREESRSRSNSRVSTNQDHVRCYRCREYNHFASECPN